MKRITVIDGQGGGIGKALIEKLKHSIPAGITITALGTNSHATAVMIKAGADHSATGENAICVNAAKADIIIGSVGIISADSMMGELTPKMANAVSKSGSVKILIPINKCNLMIAGVKNVPIADQITAAVELARSIITEAENGTHK